LEDISNLGENFGDKLLLIFTCLSQTAVRCESDSSESQSERLKVPDWLNCAIMWKQENGIIQVCM